MYRQFSKAGYRTKSKYGNKTKEYNGRYYDSIREATHAEELDWRKKAGEISEIIPQFKVALKIKNKHICHYYPDFKVIMKDGSVQFHEVKGYSTDIFRLKWKMFEALIDEIEPGAELLIIK